MSRVLRVELFAEDHAHEALIRPLLGRIAREEGVVVEVSVRSAVGGHGRALGEYKLFQKTMTRSQIGLPDFIVACIDANCRRFAQIRKSIEAETDESIKDSVVIGCPDPHVERWYMADTESFASVIGAAPRVRRRKCLRDYYKAAMAAALREARQPAPLGGIEFAAELVDAMDLFRAGKNDKSLKAFIESVRSMIRRQL